MMHAPDADRLAARALHLLAALNTAVFAALVLTIAFAAGKAHAAPACTGTDMLAQMSRADPERLARIERASAGTPNGQSLLWRIERDGAATSYLYGTMHVADPRVVDIGPQADAAFDRATTLVIETTDILDPAAMVAALAADPELTMFTDATRLSGLIPPDDLPGVKVALADRGMPLATVDRMKPWMIAAMIALPACETARKAAGHDILDVALARRAQAAGKTVEGLETTADQLGAMAALPLDFHIESLVSTLALGDGIDDIMETMVAIHVRGEPGLFWPFFAEAMPGSDVAGTGTSEFERLLVTDRNRRMAARLTPLLDAGGAFVAVGALHLPGEAGLVELLRRAGYRLHPG